METDDIIKLPAFTSPDSTDKDAASKFDHEISDAEARGDMSTGETLANSVHDAELEEGQLPETDVTEHADGNSVVLHESVNIIETVVVSDNYAANNGRRNVEDESANNCPEKGRTCFKRPRAAPDEPHPAVHIKYTSLPGDSKRKLEELLQQWSEWHGRYFSPYHESKGMLESGEGTYFPALHVGVDRSSSVPCLDDLQDLLGLLMDCQKWLEQLLGSTTLKSSQTHHNNFETHFRLSEISGVSCLWRDDVQHSKLHLVLSVALVAVSFRTSFCSSPMWRCSKQVVSKFPGLASALSLHLSEWYFTGTRSRPIQPSNRRFFGAGRA